MEETANHNLELSALNQRARSCMEKGDLQGALDLTAMILEKIGTKDRETRANILSNQGLLQTGLKGFTEALESFKEASELFGAEGNRAAVAVQQGNMGSVYRDQGEHGLSFDCYLEALGIMEELDHKPGIADQHGNIGYAYSQTGELQKGIAHFSKAEELYLNMGEDKRAGRCRQSIEALEAEL